MLLLPQPKLELIGLDRQDKFRGEHGPAFLFHRVTGIEAGDPFDMDMTTGRHSVRRIWCGQCKEEIGWLYVKAPRLSQEYKVGKYLVEGELLSAVMPRGGIAQAISPKL